MKIDYTLYLATDRKLLGARLLEAAVEEAILNGVTLVQLREKSCPAGEFYAVGQRLLAVTRRHGVPLIVNDRVDIMLALDADGVHVGSGDLPLERTRAIIGPDKILGYSAHSLAALRHAESCGADYVGIGPFAATDTKSDAAAPLGLAGTTEIVAEACVPCVAIGGINAANAAAVKATGVVGICVISAILGAADIATATRRLRAALAAYG